MCSVLLILCKYMLPNFLNILLTRVNWAELERHAHFKYSVKYSITVPAKKDFLNLNFTQIFQSSFHIYSFTHYFFKYISLFFNSFYSILNCKIVHF